MKSRRNPFCSAPTASSITRRTANISQTFGAEAEIVTPQMLRNKKILLGLFNRAKNESFSITRHGRTNEIEFFSEIKLREKFDRTSLPDYIINGLKEIK